MPGPITHIAFADKYLHSNSVENLNDFILGTIFPDIRYLAKMERDETHKRFEPDLNFSQLNSFERGWKLHIYLDDKWNRIVRNSDFYSSHKDDAMIFMTAGKILEDLIDGKEVNDIVRYSMIIKNSDFEILDVPRETVRLFCDITAEYLSTNDYNTFVRTFFNIDIANNILNGVEKIKKDQKDLDFLSGILENIFL